MNFKVRFSNRKITMTKIILQFLFLLMIVSCKGQTKKEMKNIPVSDQKETSNTVESIKTLQEFKFKKDEKKTYQEVKNSVEKRRNNLTLENNLDSVSKQFKESLLNRIIPFWEATEWSFEGHTSQPKKGEIACGYFVSTTLKHIGININKYQLAQQNPINEAKSLVLNGEIIEIEGEMIEENIKSIHKRLPEGIHFIGFDQSHVGYILKEKEQLYLIHSNYTDARGVEIETIETSTVFASYSKFYLVPLSTNKRLLKRWVNKEKIIVIKK